MRPPVPPGAALGPPGLVVRPATAADLPTVQAIYGLHVTTGFASFEEAPPDLAEITRRFDDLQAKGMVYLAAELAGRVVGYAYAAPFRPRSAYRYTVEDSIYIAGGQERRGIGRALLAVLVERTADAGFRQMMAVIGTAGHSPSVALHAALGFRPAGHLEGVGFKHGRWVDIVLMQRSLGDGSLTDP